MHRHVEALTILLFKQQSVDKALEYCAEVVKKEEAEDQQVYLHLLHLHVRLFLIINRLLHPPESTPAELKEKYFAASFQILDRYHAHLVPEQVLDEYPENTPMEKLFPFIQQATTSLTETMYNTRMKYNLIMSDYLDVGKWARSEA